MAVIEDGGTGITAKVNAEQQLAVAAATSTEFQQHSEEDGSSFIWCSDAVNPAVDDTVLLVKNTSAESLHIVKIVISGSTTSEYTVHLPTVEVTPTGGTVTGVKLNTGKVGAAEASAKSLETNNAQGDVIDSIFVLASTPYTLHYEGAILLAKDKSIGVDVVANAVLSCVSIYGFYD